MRCWRRCVDEQPVRGHRSRRRSGLDEKPTDLGGDHALGGLDGPAYGLVAPGPDLRNGGDAGRGGEPTSIERWPLALVVAERTTPITRPAAGGHRQAGAGGAAAAVRREIDQADAVHAPSVMVALSGTPSTSWRELGPQSTRTPRQARRRCHDRRRGRHAAALSGRSLCAGLRCGALNRPRVSVRRSRARAQGGGAVAQGRGPLRLEGAGFSQQTSAWRRGNAPPRGAASDHRTCRCRSSQRPLASGAAGSRCRVPAACCIRKYGGRAATPRCPHAADVPAARWRWRPARSSPYFTRVSTV